MRKRKILFGIAIIMVWLLGILGICNYRPEHIEDVLFYIEVNADCENSITFEYSQNQQLTSNGFGEKQKATNLYYEKKEDRLIVSGSIPSNSRFICINLGANKDKINIYSSGLKYQNSIAVIPDETMLDVKAYDNIEAYNKDEGGNIECIVGSNAGYVVWDISQQSLQTVINESDNQYIWTMRMIYILLVTIMFVILLLHLMKVMQLPEAVWDNRRLIISMAKTDFKSKYASSYLGTFWAFMQPIITVAIYVFVFQVGFKAGNTAAGYPYLLYLVAGICPWFFFAEAWMGSTNCLIEYSYLVKKVVFKIEVLPVIKMLSSLFVHFFFMVIVLAIFLINRSVPGITFIQLIYYLFALICFTLALSYLTAAVAPFFPDVTQIINILTQLGMWTVPIMYDEAIMPERIMRILRFNPMYYIVSGYRDSFMHGSWVWEKMGLTIWFWIVVIIIFFIADNIFRKLKVHFADVL